MKIDFLSILLSVGILQGIFLTLFLLFTKESAIKSNRILATFVFSFSLLTFNDLLLDTGTMLYCPEVFFVFDPIILLLGPLAYFYIRALTSEKRVLQSKDFIHFLPAILLWLLLIPIYILNSDKKKELIFETYTTLNQEPDLILIIVSLHLLLYFILSIFNISKYQKEIKHNFSFEEKINLKWLKYFLVITSVLYVFFAMQTVFQLKQLKAVNDLLYTIAMYLIGYYGLLKAPYVIKVSDENLGLDKVNSETELKKKYASSPLSDENTRSILQLLNTEMVNNKYYLKSDLKLSELSEYLNSPAYQISQVINEKLNMNFFDFINEFRVEEFKNRLLVEDYKNLTLLAIGFDSGFNSKAT